MSRTASTAGGVPWLRYRELAIALAMRELTVRYKRSFLGVGWALVEPVVMVVVYVAIFGMVLDADRDLDNYPLFTLLGLAPWMFLSSTMEQASATLLDHASLIRKVFFPREILIAAVVFSRLTTLLLCVGLALAIGGASYAWGTGLNATSAPLILLGLVLVAVLTYGLSLAMAALNVVMRDVSFLVRFLLRIAFYGCPIVYPLTLVPAAVRPLYELNPIVGILYFFQAAADPAVVAPGSWGIAAAFIGPFLALALGTWVFRRLRATVADLL